MTMSLYSGGFDRVPIVGCHEAAGNVLLVVIPIVIQIGYRHQEKYSKNNGIELQAIPANGTIGRIL